MSKQPYVISRDPLVCKVLSVQKVRLPIFFSYTEQYNEVISCIDKLQIMIVYCNSNFDSEGTYTQSSILLKFLSQKLFLSLFFLSHVAYPHPSCIQGIICAVGGANLVVIIN